MSLLWLWHLRQYIEMFFLWQLLNWNGNMERGEFVRPMKCPRHQSLKEVEILGYSGLPRDV